MARQTLTHIHIEDLTTLNDFALHSNIVNTSLNRCGKNTNKRIKTTTRQNLQQN